MNPEIIARSLGKAEREGDGWKCLCPVHADSKPSLSITERDGKILVICRANCDQDSVIDALRRRGLWPQSAGTFKSRSKPKTEATKTAICPVPQDARPCDWRHPVHGYPVPHGPISTPMVSLWDTPLASSGSKTANAKRMSCRSHGVGSIILTMSYTTGARRVSQTLANCIDCPTF